MLLRSTSHASAIRRQIALLTPVLIMACSDMPEPTLAVPVVAVEPSCPRGMTRSEGKCQASADLPGPVIAEQPKDMVAVPGGLFLMGCSPKQKHCDAESQPKHEVRVASFLIDRTEVTVADYRDCVTKKECEAPGTSSGSCNWDADDRERHPLNCINWKRASNYCRVQGKRLPTEAEWEKAARGNDERAYPWGNQSASCNYAVMVEGGSEGCGRSSTWPVASKPAGQSPYGAMDMAGNLWEWVSDWYDASYYSRSPNSNPAGPKSGSERTIRGGSWDDMLGAPALRTTIRVGNDPSTQGRHLGFRCARSD